MNFFLSFLFGDYNEMYFQYLTLFISIILLILLRLLLFNIFIYFPFFFIKESKLNSIINIFKRLFYCDILKSKMQIIEYQLWHLMYFHYPFSLKTFIHIHLYFSMYLCDGGTWASTWWQWWLMSSVEGTRPGIPTSTPSPPLHIFFYYFKFNVQKNRSKNHMNILLLLLFFISFIFCEYNSHFDIHYYSSVSLWL